MGGSEDARLMLHWDMNKTNCSMKRYHFILHGSATIILAGAL